MSACYGPMPGLFFEFKERVKKETGSKCQECGAQVSRSSELGIDVLLTVEMIKYASMREHDFLALVSSDRDYLPLLSYLKDQGQRVLHIAPCDAHRDMRSTTWKQATLDPVYPTFCSIAHEGVLMFATPQTQTLVANPTTRLKNEKENIKTINICEPADINDKDLRFLSRNQNTFFRKHGDRSISTCPAATISKSLSEIRKLLTGSELFGNFPYVMRSGRMEAHADENGRWISQNSGDIWQDRGA